MTDELSVHTRATPAGPVIELAGHLDHHSAPGVRALLPGLALQPGQELIIDLARLASCDSSGITVLIAARNHAHAARATVALTAVPERVTRIFRTAGLDRVFTTYPTAQAAEAARAALPSGPPDNTAQ
ncbi:STAS domain-containing protein [Dactylosporangium vinaceum]|uniref:Anti-sigma factor antagonist n=1 Tax=Dactylosporangium vinaceum TaxID=53362 RepID=A0ABV5MSD4_9ACTN|nr:STAS domain-containing protein [Dactylosporangium vinaceum]UAC00182.1 STAS domain-containing protein [Dactylosporangium vinaceum]